MSIKKITKKALFIALIAYGKPLCWGAADNPYHQKRKVSENRNALPAKRPCFQTKAKKSSGEQLLAQGNNIRDTQATLFPATKIGLLAQLYSGSIDVAPGMLALLNKQDLEQLAVIGRKESQRFPMLYKDAMNELFGQKTKFRQFLQKHNSNLKVALFDAAKNNKPWAIDYLVPYRVDVNAKKDDYGWTALMEAAIKGYGGITTQLISAGADVNAKNNNNTTALILAAMNGYEAITAQLIANGADINAKENLYHDTALMVAAPGGHGAVVAQLIAARANVNAKSIGGNTALMLATKQDQEAIVDQLIKTPDIDINATLPSRNTALSIAKCRNNKLIINILKQAGAQ